jgi:hypothetical protein
MPPQIESRPSCLPAAPPSSKAGSAARQIPDQIVNPELYDRQHAIGRATVSPWGSTVRFPHPLPCSHGYGSKAENRRPQPVSPRLIASVDFALQRVRKRRRGRRTRGGEEKTSTRKDQETAVGITADRSEKQIQLGIGRSRAEWTPSKCRSTVPGQSSKPVPAARWARRREIRWALVGRSARSTRASLHNGQRP